MLCARVMRGRRSSENVVTPRAARRRTVSACWNGCRIATSSAPSRKSSVSLRGRRLDLHDDLGVDHSAAASGASFAPAARYSSSAKSARPLARALDPHLVAVGDELLRRLGHERDALLAGRDFAGNADLHGAAP